MVLRLVWQTALKRTKVELELLTDTDMLLLVEKGNRRGTCHTIHKYAKANNKYMKDYDKNKELSYCKYWDVNNLFGWAVSQNVPVNDYKWVEDTSQFNENFIKSYNDESSEGYFNILMFSILKNYMTITMIYHFHLKE